MSLVQKQKAQQKLIIEYWYRLSQNNADISIADIINVIVEYAENFEILKFSENWMLADAFTLEHDNTMAMKSVEHNKWVLPDIEPVQEGQACWRVNVSSSVYSLPCL